MPPESPENRSRPSEKSILEKCIFNLSKIRHRCLTSKSATEQPTKEDHVGKPCFSVAWVGEGGEEEKKKRPVWHLARVGLHKSAGPPAVQHAEIATTAFAPRGLGGEPKCRCGHRSLESAAVPPWSAAVPSPFAALHRAAAFAISVPRLVPQKNVVVEIAIGEG